MEWNWKSVLPILVWWLIRVRRHWHWDQATTLLGEPYSLSLKFQKVTSILVLLFKCLGQCLWKTKLICCKFCKNNKALRKVQRTHQSMSNPCRTKLKRSTGVQQKGCTLVLSTRTPCATMMAGWLAHLAILHMSPWTCKRWRQTYNTKIVFHQSLVTICPQS